MDTIYLKRHYDAITQDENCDERDVVVTLAYLVDSRSEMLLDIQIFGEGQKLSEVDQQFLVEAQLLWLIHNKAPLVIHESLLKRNGLQAAA